MIKKNLSPNFILSADERKRAAAVFEILIAVDRRMMQQKKATSVRRAKRPKSKVSQKPKDLLIKTRLTKAPVSLVFIDTYFILGQSKKLVSLGQYDRHDSFDLKQRYVSLEQSRLL